jgi:hypothetical protein
MTIGGMITSGKQAGSTCRWTSTGDQVFAYEIIHYEYSHEFRLSMTGRGSTATVEKFVDGKTQALETKQRLHPLLRAHLFR